MSKEILDCLKCKRDICIKNIIPSQNTAFGFTPRWPAPLYNLYFDSFLLICTTFVVKTRGIVCVVYPLSRLANYRDPCKRCVLALYPRLKHRIKKLSYIAKNVRGFLSLN